MRILSHIWPREMERLVDDAAELRLPEEFYLSPRSYLILPRQLERAFDKMAVILIPSHSGDITVRRWRSDSVGPAVFR